MAFCERCGFLKRGGPSGTCPNCERTKQTEEPKKSGGLDSVLRKNPRTAKMLKDHGVIENINEHYLDAVKNFIWGKLYDRNASLLAEIAVHPDLLTKLTKEYTRGFEVKRDRILSIKPEFNESFGRYYINFGDNYDIDRVLRGYKDGVAKGRYSIVPANPLHRFVLVPSDFGTFFCKS